jgi:putative transposase
MHPCGIRASVVECASPLALWHDALPTQRNSMRLLHSKTAGWVNKLDRKPGRQIWHNFWETRLTNQRSYLARLNYVHQNAVNHGLVPVANQYPWCSAGWLERTAAPAIVRAIYRFKTDRLGVADDYEVVG